MRRAYLEGDILDLTDDLGAGREEGHGAGGQAPDVELLLVDVVHGVVLGLQAARVSLDRLDEVRGQMSGLMPGPIE